MKTNTTLVLMILLLIACTKENNNRINTVAEKNNSVTIQSPDDVPLNDLGTGLYRGYTGGLYPGGANKPPTKYAADLLLISKNIIPIDVNGEPSSEKGCIVFISMGGSTGGKNMTALIDKTKDNPLTNPYLKLMNGNQPAQKAPLSAIADSASDYWQHITQILALHKSGFKQVQVVYLETDDGVLTAKFPNRPMIIKNKIEDCLRTMKLMFTNLKVVYVLGRTRTFSNTTTPWNTEPSPYYFGWACKWAIEDQINKVPGTEYKGENKVAPILAWGFYQWADSLPRATDNFYWRYSETKDGLHANEAGQDTLSTRFQKFLLSDIYASKWYKAK